jgi:hypothetical protein
MVSFGGRDFGTGRAIEIKLCASDRSVLTIERAPVAKVENSAIVILKDVLAD